MNERGLFRPNFILGGLKSHPELFIHPAPFSREHRSAANTLRHFLRKEAETNPPPLPPHPTIMSVCVCV